MVKKGFTLLELLIVISIIGILVTVAAASYSSAQKKARNSRRMSDMQAIQNAAEQYYSDNVSQYPANETFGTTYLPAGWPSDPKPSTYVYTYTPGGTPPTTYVACAQMEGAVGNSSDTSGTVATNGAYYCVRNLQ
jgi:prepilin-type N-terminal cleavage/methylation domain-containing protein